MLKLAPKLDSEGNVDQNAQVEFETALSNMITTYVEDNEKMKLLLGETMSERDEYKKKYLNMKAMQEKRGYAAGGMIESSFTSFDENPLITSARKEVEDQRKLYESEFFNRKFIYICMTTNFSACRAKFKCSGSSNGWSNGK